MSFPKDIFILHVIISVLFVYLKRSENIIYGLVRKCVTLSLFSWTIFILDFEVKGIPTDANYCSLIADLFCYERHFMLSLSEETQSEVIILRGSIQK